MIEAHPDDCSRWEHYVLAMVILLTTIVVAAAAYVIAAPRIDTGPRSATIAADGHA